MNNFPSSLIPIERTKIDIWNPPSTPFLTPKIVINRLLWHLKDHQIIICSLPGRNKTLGIDHPNYFLTQSGIRNHKPKGTTQSILWVYSDITSFTPMHQGIPQDNHCITHASTGTSYSHAISFLEIYYLSGMSIIADT